MLSRLALLAYAAKLIRMHDAVAPEAPFSKRTLATLALASSPTRGEASLIATSSLLTILSFPDFHLWFLAWIGLVPLLVVVSQTSNARSAFLLGWFWGVIFFYGSCWWLTYPIIHYGHISPWLAYPLLLLPVALAAVFPALFCVLLHRLVARFGLGAIFLAPLIWISVEFARFAVTGQLWNAIGYSQAFHPLLIQSARWGGVYAVGFLIVAVNAAMALAFLRRKPNETMSILVVLFTFLFVGIAALREDPIRDLSGGPAPLIVAVQPNVPMEGLDDAAMEQLLNRHIELSTQGLAAIGDGTNSPRLIIWPESPMNFSYSRDPHLRKIVGSFAKAERASILLNSLEPAPNGGDYNSAVMVNEEGRIVAQYDKIRLMPFGEYVPLPQWLPGASSVRGIVGDFTPGSSYTLMPLGALRAGVFICIESAHPSIARRFANESADVLINISNDGYLGPTPVMRQHLSNAIFRAVENDRTVMRVTNSGISALIEPDGHISDVTGGFEPAVRTWRTGNTSEGTTFYTRHGDVFIYGCALISLGFISATFITRRKRLRNSVSEARP
jgi:apolipoprotein N-acyltransferase